MWKLDYCELWWSKENDGTLGIVLYGIYPNGEKCVVASEVFPAPTPRDTIMRWLARSLELDTSPLRE
jgi:hypothetical protein